MKLVAVLLTALALCGCGMHGVGINHHEPVSGEVSFAGSLSQRERAVMRSMLEYEVQGLRGAKRRVILSEWATADRLLDTLHESAASDLLPVSAIHSFKEANKVKRAWPRDFDNRFDIHFLTDAQHAEIWRDQSGWKRFYQMFPSAHGVTTMSRPGFSDDGRVALVYRACQSDWLGGIGRIFVLRLKWGRWVVTGENVGGMWIS